MPTLAPEQVDGVLKTGASARVDAGVAPRFRPGDPVLVRNMNPVGHTRLPRYVRGKRGAIERDHGVFVFPDTSAHGQGEKPQHVYSVRFAARELWGEQASARDTLNLDLFDDYLERAGDGQ
jgi:nitrile hydratase beta subunit